MGQQSYGLWTGLAVDNTAEATVTGALYGDEAGRIAILAKTARSSFIGFVVLGYAVYWASRGQAQHVEHKALFLWQKFPKFILGFVAISILATAGFFSASQLVSLGNLSQVGLPSRLRRRRPPHQRARPHPPGLASHPRRRARRNLPRHRHPRARLLLHSRSRPMSRLFLLSARCRCRR